MLSFFNISDKREYRKVVKEVYEYSFPKDEQVPFFMLQQKAKGNMSDIFAICDGNTFVGMLCTVYYQDIVFLWYLAIEKSLRGKGYGSQILHEVAEHFVGKRLILNIEEVDGIHKERVKRKHFYCKNGFQECGFKTEEYGIVYEMLCYDRKVSYLEYEQMMCLYCGNKVYDAIYRLVE